ncbi:DUF6636 domain-containing protein [Mycolicibacterium frederiksbergense]|uniref:DUF6636 domain-containing protein n=1 Tax=Mycolicibacterium frederiksbergense TaxID=117567 RepID=UPI002476E346|nr:DUF6636 domain-containing protein [Mycolicibacterium frederiksbergense]
MPQPTPVAAPSPGSVTGLANRQVDELTGFTSPSGNIGCYLDATMARCDVADRSWAPPLRPASCEFAYGQGITVGRGRPAEFVCAGDTALGAGAELGYGDSITAGALRCESAGSGITCRDTATRHGFAISREAYHLF